MPTEFRFVDLFAGLGGFHVGLSRLGGQCVFASELDPRLRELYSRNFGIMPEGDITKIDALDIPDHDVLCAGFPCQAFSKAGKREGFDDTRGTLFFDILRVLEAGKPPFFILENVPNLVGHDRGRTWQVMQKHIRDLGYGLDTQILSPHKFGIPHKRQRLFMVGWKKRPTGFRWPIPDTLPDVNVRSILDKKPEDAKYLDKGKIEILEAWQEFIKTFPTDRAFPTFTIMTVEFDQDYTVWHMTTNRADTVQRNRDLCREYPEMTRRLLDRTRHLKPTYRKLEWQVGKAERDIWQHVIQFRMSGIRIRNSRLAPTILANVSQVPIIGWERRYMTYRELSRLQSLDTLKHTLDSPRANSKALGNVVNAEVVYQVAKALIRPEQKTEISCAGFREPHKKSAGKDVSK